MAGIDKALQQTGRELANLRMTYSTDVDRLRHELDTERQTGRTIKVGAWRAVPCRTHPAGDLT